MITRTRSTCQINDVPDEPVRVLPASASIEIPADPSSLPRWQDELNNLIRDPAELLELLELDPQLLLEGALGGAEQFPLRVPRPYANRIEKGNPHDPLLRQVLPLGEELLAAPGYSCDPLEEADSNPCPGLIHKYRSRVLFIVSSNCAINCRYCFRRHFPYAENAPSRSQWQQALDYISADPSINEVIYSGGDPLAVADKQLAWLTQQIAQIPHITRLRIHTRLPIVVPSRLNAQCLDWLTDHRLQTVMVLHANHPNEIDSEVSRALQPLKQAGITLLNQAVLLKGVNDRAETLIELSETLFSNGIMPYYLHQLDKVAGAQHFAVGEQEALALQQQLLAALPGYLVPKLVREIAGRPSKTPLF